MFKLYKNTTGSFIMIDDATNRAWTVKSSNANTEHEIRRVGFAPKDAELNGVRADVYGAEVRAWVVACEHIGVPARLHVPVHDPITKLTMRFVLPTKASFMAPNKVESLTFVVDL